MPLTVAEFFLEQHSWPDSRKTAWLFGFASVFTTIGATGYLVFIGLSDAADMRWAYGVVVFGVSSTVAVWVLGLVLWRLGREGSWAAHLGGWLYLAFIGAAGYANGTWTSIYVAWVPMVVLLAAVWFDLHKATSTLVAGSLAIVVPGVLTAADLIPYAPGVLHRDIDIQSGPGPTAASLVALTAGMTSVWLMLWLAARARETQDQRLQRAFAIIRTYVPGQVADALLADDGHAPHQHERRRITVFFSDLVGFTDISDDYEPEDLSRLLNEYFTEMTRIAHEYGGTIDELVGDAILVFFGAPTATDDRDHALRAVKMARAMQERLAVLNHRWEDEGRPDHLVTRMGINTGVVTVGNFGSPERMKYAALGRHVNAAARLQARCEPGRILISRATWLLVRDVVPCSPHGVLELKGLHAPVETYVVDPLV